MAEKLASGKRIRLWSAGCSSGEEPYTLGMELLTAVPKAAEADALILASDIDPKILEVAQKGEYRPSDLDQVPEDRRKRFFSREGDTCSAMPELRNLIRFRRLNLHSTWPMQTSFDAIFCRNVVIYFDDDRQRALWPRFREALEPGGWLILGHSERISPPGEFGFTSTGVTIYQKT